MSKLQSITEQKHERKAGAAQTFNKAIHNKKQSCMPIAQCYPDWEGMTDLEGPVRDNEPGMRQGGQT